LGEEDRLNGGTGADLFVLGDSNRGYYNGYGWGDCVIIEDFNKAEDSVQLNASSKYWLGSWSSTSDSFLYEYKNNAWEGVAVFEDIKLDNTHLQDSNLFTRV
jgi:hypothetical protein